MQRDFIEPGGFGASLGNDVTLLAADRRRPSRACSRPARAAGWPIVHTRESAPARPVRLPAGQAAARRAAGCASATPARWAASSIAGEPGDEIVPELAPARRRDRDRQARQGRVLRHRPAGEALAGSGITHLVFAGVTTEVCVQTTMREANDRGYDCLLVEDATESYFPEFKAAALEMIRAQGAIVGWTATLADVLLADE